MPTRPAPPLPELFSSAARIQHGDLPTGARIAGGVLIVNVVGILLERMVMPADTKTPLPVSGTLVSILIDLFIGYKLLRGEDGSSVLGWARFRVVAGMLLFTGLQIAAANPLVAVIQFGFSAGLLMLLLGDPGKLRMAMGVLLAGAYFSLEMLGLVALTIGHNPVTQVALMTQVDGASVTVVEGAKFPYNVTLPTAGKWYLRNAAVSRKESPDSDRWIIRPDRDAHVIVIAENLAEPLPMQALRDAVVANFKKTGDEFEVLEERPLVLGDQDATALLLTTRRKVGAIEVKGYLGLVLKDHEFYQVIAFALANQFVEMGPELKQIVESFKSSKTSPAL
ncbi:MAG: hypothetical protein ABI672_15825 [Vicinamibacteria bacterium]